MDQDLEEEVEETKKRRGKSVFLIGDLDTNTRLVASAHSINIEIKKEVEAEDGTNKEVWAAKLFYPDVKSAIYGYMKYKSKNPENLKNVGLKAILEHIDSLYTLVDNAGKSLQNLWDKNIKDVIKTVSDSSEE
jgi:hypothetical protein